MFWYCFKGPIEEYLQIDVPLYEASTKCDWVAAKAILDKRPELVRFCITENGDTALHVGASTRNGWRTEEFVENLVGFMKGEDLELENKNYNTALCLAAAAENLKVVKIMVEKNRSFLTVMPLHAAASAGNYHVVKYLFEKYSELGDDYWINDNHGCLLQICVETNMFGKHFSI
ncbi:ankyrin repeat-containing domain, PGG domain protein [Artemisia annua]|uniref:Ankyrin repeat-containing domain, PGG domain protein n=1 Tax=Artemisia annua TaxID=35608 RepID=A0A2U1LBE1_ARTAN|nr:ankyrin repeat-containing domain, PGG domain protein [Artemisia annua]